MGGERYIYYSLYLGIYSRRIYVHADINDRVVEGVAKGGGQTFRERRHTTTTVVSAVFIFGARFRCTLQNARTSRRKMKFDGGERKCGEGEEGASAST